MLTISISFPFDSLTVTALINTVQSANGKEIVKTFCLNSLKMFARFVQGSASANFLSNVVYINKETFHICLFFLVESVYSGEPKLCNRQMVDGKRESKREQQRLREKE